MNKKKLFDAIDGTFAYDEGATDSGVSDPANREMIRTFLKKDDSIILLSEYAREYLLSKKAMSAGHSLDDVKEFMDWLSNSFNYDI